MNNGKNNIDFSNLIEVTLYFSDLTRCKEFLAKMRWNGKPVCRHCKHEDKIYTLKNGHYKCSKCRKPFSVTKGTIFENSPIPLQKWFVAIYLITSHKKGISSCQLARDINITQKSAWFVLQRIRFAIRTKDFSKPLTGTVECDESFIGGKNKNRHQDKKVAYSQGRSVKDKVPVFGMVQRKGNLITMSVKNTDGKTLRPIIVKNVSRDATIMTDEWKAYKLLNIAFNHQVIRHAKGEYRIKDCHTNTIEGFWSLLKCGIVGIYHSISIKHIDKYLDEFQFRYNSRNLTEKARFLDMLSVCESRLTYQNLING